MEGRGEWLGRDIFMVPPALAFADELPSWVKTTSNHVMEEAPQGYRNSSGFPRSPRPNAPIFHWMNAV